MDSSLLRAGLWCLSAHLIAATPGLRPDPATTAANLNRFVAEESDASSHWACADGNVAVALLQAVRGGGEESAAGSDAAAVAAVESALAPALTGAAVEAAAAMSSAGNGCSASPLRAAVATHTCDQVLGWLRKAGVRRNRQKKAGVRGKK